MKLNQIHHWITVDKIVGVITKAKLSAHGSIYLDVRQGKGGGTIVKYSIRHHAVGGSTIDGFPVPHSSEWYICKEVASPSPQSTVVPDEHYLKERFMLLEKYHGINLRDIKKLRQEKLHLILGL